MGEVRKPRFSFFNRGDYASDCFKCGQIVKADERRAWDTQEKHIYHIKCSPEPEPKPVQEYQKVAPSPPKQVEKPKEEPKKEPLKGAPDVKETYAVIKVSPERSYAFASRSSQYAMDKLEGGTYSESGESFEDLLKRVRGTVKKVFEEAKA